MDLGGDFVRYYGGWGGWCILGGDWVVGIDFVREDGVVDGRGLIGVMVVVRVWVWSGGYLLRIDYELIEIGLFIEKLDRW